MSSNSHAQGSNLPVSNDGNGQVSLARNGNAYLNGYAPYPNGMTNSVVDLPADDNQISFQHILVVLRRRAWVLGLATFASSIGIFAFILTRPPTYSGAFRMLVEPVTEGSRLADSLTSDTLQTLKPLGDSIGKGSGLDYVSQIEVLKSEKLLDPVLQRIQSKYPKLNYKAFRRQFKVSRPKDSKILDVTYSSADPAQIKFVLEELSKAFVDYSLIDRQTNLNRGIEFVAEQIQRQLREVDNLEVKLEGFRRQNNLLDPATSATSLSQRIRTIASERQANRVQLAAARTLYKKLRSQVGLAPSAALSVANLSEAPIYQELLRKLRELDRQIAVESARFTTETPIVRALMDQRQELLPLLEAEAQRVFGGNVVVSDIAQRQGFQGSIGRNFTRELVETVNRVQVLQTQEQALGQALQVLKQQTQNLAGVSRDYGRIQRDLTIATSSLGRLMTARENLQLELTRQVNPWEIISNINDDSIRLKNNRTFMLLLGTLASLGLGILAALIAEQLDRVYHTVEELQDTGLPCLGMIHYNSSLSQDKSLMTVGQLANEDSMQQMSNRAHRDHMMFLEAFYSLDANIRLLSSDHPIRAVTVSSTSPSDGKSTISSHLAWAAVTMGRRVLIIDTDMRRPQVHLWFGVQNLRGLSNAITSDTDVRQLIQESPQDPNLHVLAAGPLPPAPGRLLASKKMQMIIQSLTAEYDLVICDAPPVQGFADAKLTAACTDGMLIVLGLGKTDRNNFAQTLQELESSSPAPLLGIVANGMKRNPNNHYQHYYSRYYARAFE
ncbi:polysaccharide biosynthesis tyrosine autokinase [filamentous cyanobacterium LEGE 11480]|uniref:non-specific protein-tyrosine kinase n=1 Tax=Romeriopsis navalis LEGE 11480 TaxID=2777977 RepID=A0A928Z541_9CYAN|nr:polysaccharide biosynthesis tyrosine autokinase [Romeriopsis navalis]MBE9033271.1 polysaccharide biosynthesis tyrosine autokinase [Romeriopsis navalis LEGE 11480]